MDMEVRGNGSTTDRNNEGGGTYLGGKISSASGPVEVEGGLDIKGGYSECSGTYRFGALKRGHNWSFIHREVEGGGGGGELFFQGRKNEERRGAKGKTLGKSCVGDLEED